jgi:tripartite-type tricarboxylate transporter receptor subunit TctC
MENAMRFLISTLTLASLLAAFVASDRPGEAAGYPAGPVKIVVPYPAGGPADFTARVLAEKLSEKLGGSFIVENLPGAGGAVGTATAARAAADGQTVVLVVQDFVIAPIVKTNVPFDPFKSDRVAEIMAQPDVKERFAALGFTPATGTSAEFATFLKSESDLWKKIVDDAHIQIN